MALVGVQLAKMHQGDVIHGDLTTSNMMLRQNRSLPGEPTELVALVQTSCLRPRTNCLLYFRS
jgi:tRNA A-37 threonylcarbamoyl transferase component Bud32